MNLKSTPFVVATVLKFRYFLLCLLLLSCGDTKTKKEQPVSRQEATPSKVGIPSKSTILFFGDSLTAGYGLELEQAFPALVQQRLDSLELPYVTINSGISGETSTGGLNRIDWVLRQNVSVFVLELGANDGLRGIPLDETKANLQKIINTVKTKNPETKIVLAGMQIPPNMGPEYTSTFRTIFPQLAQENSIPLIPFLLENVAGIPELNLEDGIHPTAKGHQMVMENVWKVLKEVL